MKGIFWKVAVVVLVAALITLAGFFGLQAYQQRQFGLLLFSPLDGREVLLINKKKEVVHSWQTEYPTKGRPVLLEDGSILKLDQLENPVIEAGGGAGQISKYNWDGDLVWRYTLNNELERIHHDFEVLPNGNILTLIWKSYSKNTLVDELGRDPETTTNNGLWIDAVIELEPMGDSDAERVWEWDLGLHTVQERNPELENFGEISQNPDKIDINLETPQKVPEDWNHINGLDYNPDTEEILLSAHSQHEIFIIDHRSEDGIKYRFGNPQNTGEEGEQILFKQHNPTWIDDNTILLFNNGIRDTDRAFSTVDEYNIKSDGEYQTHQANLLSRYERDGFFADFISGAQRLPSGNTLITEGPDGVARIIDEDQNDLWTYQHKDGEDTPVKVFRYTWYPPEYLR